MAPVTQTAPEAPSQAPPSILFVDDDRSILETLVEIFEDMGLHVDTATSGRQALSKLEERYYNMALLDIQLPDMLGTELLTEVRRLRPDTICVMATGNTSLTAAFEGAYAYLVKPIEIPHVKAVVRRALDQQRLEVENRRLIRELTALHNMTDEGLSTLDLEPLLDRVLQQLCADHRSDGGAIYLLDEQDDLAPHATLYPQPVDVSSVHLGEGLVGQSADRREVLTAFGDELASDPLARDGVRASIAAPLWARHRLVGAVRLDRLAPEPFGLEDVHLLGILTERAAVLVENARLYEAERHLRSEAQTFSMLARSLVQQIELTDRLALVAEYLTRVTHIPRCGIWLQRGPALDLSYVTGVSQEEAAELEGQTKELDELPAPLREILEIGFAQAIPDAEAAGIAAEETLLKWGVRSALLVPLRSAGRIVGLAALSERDETREFTDQEMRQAQIIGFLAAVAIQQAMTIQEERDMARTLAESFLSTTPVLSGVQVASRFVPASEVALVGGDYFDFIELDQDHTGIVIGDVCGKGLTAAIYTAMAKYMLRAYAFEDRSPRRVITQLNQALYNQMSEDSMFITMVYGVLDRKSGTFTYTNAGHPPPILYQPSTGEAQDLPPSGGMVGALPDREFDENTVALEPGSVLTMFTDGVTEARTGGVMLENEGVQQVVVACAAQNADAIARAIYDRAREFASNILRDDVAIIVIKYEG